MKFVIDRSKWVSGHPKSAKDYRSGMGDTLLLNEEGFMCCLGLIASQLGVPDSKLLKIPSPAEVDVEEYFKMSILVSEYKDSKGRTLYDDSDLATAAVDINDNRYSRGSREISLTNLFKSYGHELEFTGQYPE